VNYTELKAQIQNFSENYSSEFESTIPTFVEQAEQRIYNTVELPALRKNVTGNVTANNKYLATPSDYLSTFSLAVVDTDGSYQYLLDKDVNFIREAYPIPTATGLPKFYGQFDNNTFIIGPTPNANYGMELHYFYYPESIVTAGTSWLGDNFDSVLLYGALVEAATYMKGETDLINQYTKQYSEAMVLLKQLGDGKLRQDAYRSGQVRDAVR
jgi:hypothetical protein